jgi:hypothetical protein
MTLQVGDYITVGSKRSAAYAYSPIVGATATILRVGDSPFVEIKIDKGRVHGTWGIHPSDCIPLEATNSNYTHFLKKGFSLLGE